MFDRAPVSCTHVSPGQTSDNTPVTLSGSLFFRVTNSYDACFRVSEFQQNIRNIGTSAMRSVVGHFSYDEVIGDRNKINQRLHDVIGSSIEVRVQTKGDDLLTRACGVEMGRGMHQVRDPDVQAEQP